MKNKILILLLVLIAVNLTSCTFKEQTSSPIVSVKIISHLKQNHLEWKIENLDKTDDITFKDGNIMNYTIRHISSNKITSNENSKDKNTFILRHQEAYSQKVTLDDIKEKGEYEATFWAVTKDNISYKSICTFYID